MTLVAPYLMPLFLRTARLRYPDVLWQGQEGERRVALTFDDGPSRFTPALLDVLRDEGVTATFFVLGDRAERRPEVLRRAAGEGHLIALHGREHFSPAKLSAAALTDSLEDVRRIVTEVLPGEAAPAKWYYRPPYGHLNGSVLRIVRGLRIRLVMLGILPGEHLLWPPGWREAPARTVDRVKRDVRPGSIICLHDGESLGKKDGVYDSLNAAATAAAVIRELKGLDYTFATVSQFDQAAASHEKAS